MNFPPLRFKISGAESNVEVLRAVKAGVIDGQAHQELSFRENCGVVVLAAKREPQSSLQCCASFSEFARDAAIWRLD